MAFTKPSFSKFENDTVKNVTDFIRAEGIQCDLDEVETADIWTDQAEFDEVVEALKLREQYAAGKLDVDYLAGHKVFKGQDARDYFKMPHIVGGVTFPGNTVSSQPHVTHICCRRTE